EPPGESGENDDAVVRGAAAAAPDAEAHDPDPPGPPSRRGQDRVPGSYERICRIRCRTQSGDRHQLVGVPAAPDQSETLANAAQASSRARVVGGVLPITHG